MDGDIETQEISHLLRRLGSCNATARIKSRWGEKGSMSSFVSQISPAMLG